MATDNSRDTPPKTRFLQLNDSDVAAMTDSGSFSRGRTYFRQGRIHDASIQGNIIEAECDGSEYEPYLVRATILVEGQKGPNPSSYSCTCPRGGFCKHVVALLLTWIDSPQSFQPSAPISELLAGRNTGELIAIIEAMVARHRDLRSLLELGFPATASPNGANVDLSALRREVKRVLGRLVSSQYDGTYRYLHALPIELEALLDRLHGWADEDAWANAQAVCTMLLSELVETLPSIQDDEGVLAGLAFDCQELLSTTFSIQDDLPPADRLSPEARLAAFKALFEIWRLDIFVLGGMDLGGLGPEVIVQFASPEELDQVQAWLDGLPEADGWTRDMTTEFQTMIWEAYGLTDAALYEKFRETGMWRPAFDMLIELGRYEDAMSTARHHLRTFPEIMDAMTEIAALGPDWKAQAIQVIEDFAWEVEGKKPLDDAKLKAWLNHQRGTRSTKSASKPRVATQRRRGDTGHV